MCCIVMFVEEIDRYKVVVEEIGVFVEFLRVKVLVEIYLFVLFVNRC